jgi:hypothetical protein
MLIKICLNEICSKFRVSRYLSDNFLIQEALKQGNALSPLFLNFPSERDVGNVQGNLVGLKLNGSDQLLAYAGNVMF